MPRRESGRPSLGTEPAAESVAGGTSPPVEAGPAPEPEPQPQPEQYRCVKKSRIREGCEMDSGKLGVLSVGSVIVALEKRTLGDGIARVRFDGGWVSKVARDGSVCLEPVTPAAGVVESAVVHHDLMQLSKEELIQRLIAAETRAAEAVAETSAAEATAATDVNVGEGK